MTLAAFFIVISYGFYVIWWAGHSYGPRFMVDVLPIFCYLINYAVTTDLVGIKQNKFRRSFLFCVVLVISLFTQVVGAFGNTAFYWNAVPVDVDFYHERLWQVRDSQIERHTKALYYSFNKPSIDSSIYLQGLEGQIKGIENSNNQISPLSISVGEKVFFKAHLVNIGNVKWYGYDSAIARGEVRVRGYLFDSNNQVVNENRLYIRGITKPHQAATAIGTLTFPKKPGKYRLVFDLVSEGITAFPRNQSNSFLELDVNLLKFSQEKFSQEIEVHKLMSVFHVGEITTLPVTVKNTSNFVWQNQGNNPVNLSYQWLDSDGNIVVFDGERTPLPENIPPQQAVRINATIRSPEVPGNYMLSLSMVKEGVIWFNEVNPPTTVAISIMPTKSQIKK
jgi:hypothetical protein